MLTEQQTLELFPEEWERNHEILLKFPNGLPKDDSGNQSSSNDPENEIESKKSNTESSRVPLPAESFPRFGVEPNNTDLDYVLCPTCDRPYLSNYIEEHNGKCVEKNSLKRQTEKDVSAAVNSKETVTSSTASVKNGSKAAHPKLNGSSGDASNHSNNTTEVAPSKRRKVEESKKSTKANASSKKDVGKKKNTKQKGPVDVDKQCGVLLPNNLMCARSLTCKTHSMSSKRAVPGRSQPYDVLLASCQKKNQAKIQRQILETAKESEEQQHETPVDSDEEVDFIMNALQQSGNKPLEHRTVLPVKRRHTYFRTRELIAAAFRHGEQGMQVTGTILGRVVPFSAR
ncbi:SAGA complex deubiquitinating submodule subunit Sgf73 [Schizosaccharomyces osmophilus]|uniref:SAGA complex deubiquitinating submodule subunit Sgf73 n=1 Tax=Schizosaccharomyces osmophilus TaxID=2545709 RepID=A0AAE9WI18_9SCHI|nr:SAGA complex deubiquitinating submodule subunit Sgf73 [Schizosaccharomyces osmophilus]WBW75252.1 SAGA complex deubiquitinating submodule subunit Sgf73 [Schizosaccharomyces osmophilus]